MPTALKKFGLFFIPFSLFASSVLADGKEHKVCLHSQENFEKCLQKLKILGGDSSKAKWLTEGVKKGYVVPSAYSNLIPSKQQEDGVSNFPKREFQQDDFQSVVTYYNKILEDLKIKLTSFHNEDKNFFNKLILELDESIQKLSFPEGYSKESIIRIDELIKVMRAFTEEKRKEINYNGQTLSGERVFVDPKFRNTTETRKPPRKMNIPGSQPVDMDKIDDIQASDFSQEEVTNDSFKGDYLEQDEKIDEAELSKRNVPQTMSSNTIDSDDGEEPAY